MASLNENEIMHLDSLSAQPKSRASLLQFEFIEDDQIVINSLRP